jgi:hypothetical protein
LRTRLLQYNGWGEPTRPEASLREKTKNLVSMNVPEVIESFRESSRKCGGESMVVLVRGNPHYVSIKVWLNRGRSDQTSPARFSTRLIRHADGTVAYAVVWQGPNVGFHTA